MTLVQVLKTLGILLLVALPTSLLSHCGPDETSTERSPGAGGSNPSAIPTTEGEVEDDQQSEIQEVVTPSPTVSPTPSPTPGLDLTSEYVETCQPCHPGCKAGVGKTIFELDLTIEEWTSVVRNGAPGMPPYNTDTYSDANLAHDYDVCKGL